MMPNRETIERLKETYPEGTRVELVAMSDTYAPPKGTQGTVTGVGRHWFTSREMGQWFKP